MNKKMTNRKKNTIILMILLTSIVAVLQGLGVTLRFGNSLFAVALVGVPVIIGSVIGGPWAGAWLGFVFGCAVLVSGDANLFLQWNPIGSTIMVIVKGMAAGYLSGLIYRAFKDRFGVLTPLLSAIIFTLTNTGIFLLYCMAVVKNNCLATGAEMGITGSAFSVIYQTFVGYNLPVELLTNIFIGGLSCAVIIQAENQRKERMQEEEKARQHHELIQAIARQYFCSYDIDVENRRMKVIRVPENVLALTGEEGNADQTLELMKNNFAAEESHQTVSAFINLDTLDERMHDTSYVSCEYRSLKYGWCRASFVEVDRDEAGHLKRIIFIAQIIDEEKRKELEQIKALQKARRETEIADKLVALLSRDYVNVFIVDRKNRTIRGQKLETSVMEDLSLERQEVYPYDEFIHTFGTNRTHPDDSAFFISDLAYDNVLEKLKDNGEFTHNFRIVTDGQVLNYRARYVDFPENDEIIIGCISTDEIIANEAKQRELLEDALAAAKHANRAKTIFLTNMSHDIRTPMNAIIGFSELASSHIDEPERLTDYLAKIRTSGNHLLSLINDILDMSRIESGKVAIDEKEVHLPQIMHELKNIIQVDARSKSLEVLYDAIDVHDEYVWCDRLRLSQIILNCLSNAVKFTPAGGTISLKITQVASDDPDKASYQFRVKDTGIGMSEEFAQHIFEPFERERTSTVSGIQGTGLGMAITKNIVDLMGGTIEVSSAKGKGTEFTISLSFRKADAPEKIVKEFPSLKDGQVLVADDDIDTCVSVSEMLKELGMRPEWTVSGKEALIRAGVAKQQDDPFRMYIIDWLIPDMNGVEVVRRMRAQIGGNDPVLMLSAYDWTAVEDEARQAGVSAFIDKPVFMSGLCNALEYIVDTEGHNKKDVRSVDGLKGLKILLVEDNELNMEIAMEVLHEQGAHVDTAADGSLAVDMVEKADPDAFDLILMDVQMPVMDGYEAARRIRALDDNRKAMIPIIAMTANAFEEDRQLALEAGMNEHIAKPIDINKLIATIGKVLNR